MILDMQACAKGCAAWSGKTSIPVGIPVPVPGEGNFRHDEQDSSLDAPAPSKGTLQVGHIVDLDTHASTQGLQKGWLHFPVTMASISASALQILHMKDT